jgi:hypothetical protein
VTALLWPAAHGAINNKLAKKARTQEEAHIRGTPIIDYYIEKTKVPEWPQETISTFLLVLMMSLRSAKQLT